MVSAPTRPCRCGGCHLCRLYAASPRHRAAWGGPPARAPKAATVALPCVHEGAPCPPPQGADPRRFYYRCDAGKGVVCRCRCGPGKCDRYTPDAGEDDPSEPPAPAGAPPAPVRVRPVPLGNLVDGAAHARFNASLVPYRGRLVLAYRTGWSGARVHVCDLNADLNPGPSVTLHGLRHRRANVGQEDPRLFLHGGRLHVSYIGVERAGRHGVRTHQMFARLTPDGRGVEDVFAPDFPGRALWEKNWSFFDPGDGLYAVYDSAPAHRVLRVESNAARLVASTPNPFAWGGGHLRGGAPPVRVGDRYYHWTHGAADPGHPAIDNGRRRYSVGVTVFEARPPFRAVAQTPEPLLWADPTTNPDPGSIWADVVFPNGAYLDGGKWVVSMGVHDRWIDVAEWDAAAVDAYLGLAR